MEFWVHPAELLTANQRMHWASKARLTKGLRDQAHWVCLGAQRSEQLRPMNRARCVVTVAWPDRRRRDVDNIRPTIKALIDGMVDAGLLPDDNDAHLIGPDLRALSEPHDGAKRHTHLRFDFHEIGTKGPSHAQLRY